ncbi:hypothetical protein AALB39_05750 [Lachnospiraceae bacterium 54-53]
MSWEQAWLKYHGAEIEKSMLTMHKVTLHGEENMANESSTVDKTRRD